MGYVKKLLSIYLIAFTSSISFSCKNISSTHFKTSYDYVDLINKHIPFLQIFNVQMDEYYVYIYQKNCLHCMLIKQNILSYGLAHDDLYLIEASSDIPIGNNIEQTIGADCIEKLFIIGTPTLIKIKEGKVVINTYQEDIILSLLNTQAN